MRETIAALSALVCLFALCALVTGRWQAVLVLALAYPVFVIAESGMPLPLSSADIGKHASNGLHGDRTL